jgi:hypothetical protein
VMRVPNSRKWFIRSFMLLSVLAAYGGTAVGTRNLIRVAEETESGDETFVVHEINETRRGSSNPKQYRERRHGETNRGHAQPDFRCHWRLRFVNEQFRLLEAFDPACSPRAPPVFS